MLAENLHRVRERIQGACHRAGRDPSSVTLVCVTKHVPLERIREAVALGVADIGENRVQDARAKHTVLGSAVRWHLIGHLQRNKAKLAVELFDMIHSVDSGELASELDRQVSRKASSPALRTPPAAHNTPRLEVLIQVNVAGEAAKFGCRPEQARTVADAVRALPHLALCGLMTIPPLVDDPEQARPHFRRLRELRDDLAAALNLDRSTLNLSMGMSHDFEVAIEEGADLVRIGTAIFGTRPQGGKG